MKTNTMRRRSTFLLAVILAATLVVVPATPVLANQVDSNVTTGTVTFTSGGLHLTSTPGIDFGSHPITSNAGVYAASTISSTIRVDDLRGSGAGWKLTVALSPFQNQTTAQPSLAGASITVAVPIVAPAIGSSGLIPALAPLVPITLTSDNTALTVLSASLPGAGMGGWICTWAEVGVVLNVPAGTAVVGANNANLTWSLSDTP